MYDVAQASTQGIVCARPDEAQTFLGGFLKLTNKFGYPATIIKAIENDGYSKGDSEFSATGLIEPPRKRVLTARHKDELTEDADDGIFRLFGHLGHALVERAGTGLNTIAEKRFFGVVAGAKISAQIDSLSLESDGTLIDWKFTTVYGFKRGTAPKREWVAQLNIQNYLVGIHGYVAKSLKIWGVLRDWRPGEKEASERFGTPKERQGDRFHAGYPEKLGFHDIPMYSKEAAEKFITQRIEAHRAADKELPLCSQDDNWKWKRCSGGYCNVASFCDQYQGYLKQKRETKI